MADRCDLCKDEYKLEMERAYMGGESFLQISKKYGMAYYTVRNHMQNHLSRQIQQAYERKSLDEGFNLFDKIDDILTKAKDIFDRNYNKQRDGMALKAISEQRNILELLSKISYAYHQSKQAEQEQAQHQTEQEHEFELEKAFSKLNRTELSVFNQLYAKMTDEHSNTVIDESYFAWELRKPQTKPMTRTKTPKTSPVTDEKDKQGYKEKENVQENEENTDKTKPVRPRPIPYTRLR
ncbi:MAG: hypothetical protein K9I68_00305 [Bacteroidales bacterium]|nr:hypothetical protein [Bacteroidales bacterium]MCF8336420.1 hypothetical protein [Bacteroidales bacterium]